MKDHDFFELFQKTKALLTGHFELTSGLHSDQYFQCALVLQFPDICELLAKELKTKLGDLPKPDVVMGPALGGVTLAYELARVFGVRGIFSERKEERMQLRRGFRIDPGEKVIVVEDVVTTGGSVKEVIQLVLQAGGEVVAVGSVVNRSSAPIDFKVPFRSLITMEVKAYPPGQCPLCAKHVPIDKPGSKNIKR